VILPNFLVIGAARSGTTSLYQYLKQHPQIYMCPIKETNFFAHESGEAEPSDVGSGVERGPQIPAKITSIEDYAALFQAVSNEKAIGEVSPGYLPSPIAPRRIRQHIPDAKLIAILRDPVERAYSAYLWRVTNGRAPREEFASIPRLLRGERDWWSKRRHKFVRVGFYYIHLKRYLEHFARGQIRCFLYEDLKADALGMLQDIFGFLKVDAGFRPDVSTRRGATGIPRSRALHTILAKSGPLAASLKRFLPGSLRQRIVNLQNRNILKPQLATQVRREWIEVYREDIVQLQDLLGRDLSAWLQT
jgi:hypothetical protein